MKLHSFKNLKKILLFSILLPFIYSALVLIFVWWQCYFSSFQGGKNGQLDAYRHTLASAVVAYTSSPKMVALVTAVMENENSAANLMDQHNNAIGANIGAHASSISSLPMLVNVQITQGKVNTSGQNQTTWLPKNWWGEGLLW